MIFEHQSKNKKILFTLFAILLIAGVSYAAWLKLFQQPKQMYCTLEAMQCPDGSYVGRSGPHCAFPDCPQENNDSWKTMNDSTTGITFRYPEALPTTYIHTQDWPPQIQVQKNTYSCKLSDSNEAQGTKTEKVIVNGREYCRTTLMEGAAGSTYTQYAYAFPKNNGTAVLTFSLRAVQCGNYDDPEKTVCEKERQEFTIDTLVDQIIHPLYQ